MTARVTEIEGMVRQVGGKEELAKFRVGDKGVMDIQMLGMSKIGDTEPTFRVKFSDGRAETHYQIRRPAVVRSEPVAAAKQ
jgi:hypothetical protein